MKRILALGALLLTLAGCGTVAAAQPSDPATQAPATEAPAQQTVYAFCTLGYWDDSNFKFYPIGSTPPAADSVDQQLKARVTVSLAGSASGSELITGITIIYYSSESATGSSEVGSGSVGLDQVLVPGASLDTKPTPDANAPAGAVACTAPSVSESP